MHNITTDKTLEVTRQRTLKRWLAGLLVAMLTVLSFTRMAGGTAPLRVAEGPSDILGLTLRYALPDGEYIERSFISETRAKWKLLSGVHRGDQGSETVTLKAVAPGIYFVNAVDPLTGTTTSDVFDLTTGTVTSFVTRPNPDDPQKRLEKFGSGTIEVIKGAGDAHPAMPVS